MAEPVTPFALVGAGAMGAGLLYEAFCGSRFRPVAVYDRSAAAVARTRDRLLQFPEAARVPMTTSRAEFSELAGAAGALVDASTAPHDTLPFLIQAVETGCPVFMMNSEADLAHGPELLAAATAHRTVYSSVDGDQPAVIKRLVDRVSAWGLRPALLGNIKGFLDRRATPESIAAEARIRDLDPVMCCAFTDGTKLAIEMALVANALNARVFERGMIGPALDEAADAAGAFDLDHRWDGIRPIVDYVLGARPHGGVFVVGHTDDVYRQRMLRYYKMGDGPFYTFTRPFHLCHFETWPAIAECLRAHAPLLAPVAGRLCDVFAVAKRPLCAGEVLDGIGGSACYGVIADVGPATSALLRICDSEGLRLTRPIAVDTEVTVQACEPAGVLR